MTQLWENLNCFHSEDLVGCGYHYLIRQRGCMALTAFRERKHFDAWLRILGLTLAERLSDTENQTVDIHGKYYTRSCYTASDVAEFHALVATETRWLNNGDYTIGKVTTDADYIRTVWYLNPNVDRHVFNYAESRQMVG